MPTSDYTPTVTEVAALLRARTRDSLGNEVGTFNANTSPTLAEAESIIATTVRSLSSVVGADIPNAPDPDGAGDVDALRDSAQHLATLKAAMLIELSYYPEQIGTDRSPYNAYKGMYDQDLKGLLEAILEARGGGGEPGDAVGSASQLPSFYFPPDDGGLIGWGTLW